MTTIDPLSLSTCKLEISLKSNDDEENVIVLGTGTGFFYKYEQEPYLITNWHNVKKDEKTLAVPEFFKTTLYTYSFLQTDPTQFKIFSSGAELSLYNADGSPNWFEHPTHNNTIDVIALPISDWILEENEKIMYLNELAIHDDMIVQVGDDVFIIGYPFALTSDVYPIWKRGSIASELESDIDGLPKFYVDSASRSGMSGSPVLCSKEGMYPSINTQSAFLAVSGKARKLVGVYSGRIGVTFDEQGKEVYDDILKAQLGIVWKKIVIEEILQSKTKGKDIKLII